MKAMKSLLVPLVLLSNLFAADPCHLLSIDDIKAIFPQGDIKITTNDTSPINPLGAKRCFWDADENDMKFVQLTISEAKESRVRPADQFANNKQFIENVKTISSIGDDAYYGGSGLKMGAGLHILLKSGYLLNITVGLGRGNGNDERHIEIEKTLAAKVITNLQKP